jgi:hypothetical protein
LIPTLQGFYKGDTSILNQPSASWLPALAEPLVIQGNYQMTAQSNVRDEPLLLLHFILSSINPTANPARLVSEMMTPYLLGNTFKYQEITFDLSTDELIAHHAAKMSQLVKELKQ